METKIKNVILFYGAGIIALIAIGIGYLFLKNESVIGSGIAIVISMGMTMTAIMQIQH